eukprot:4685199-Prymnesium_polylepis.1
MVQSEAHPPRPSRAHESVRTASPVTMRGLVPVVMHQDGSETEAGPVGVESSASKWLLRLVLRCFSNT